MQANTFDVIERRKRITFFKLGKLWEMQRDLRRQANRKVSRILTKTIILRIITRIIEVLEHGKAS